MEKIRILIVEDEWIVNEELKELAILFGYEVVGQESDGVSALDILEKYPVDIVIVDIRLSGPVDGIELARYISRKYKCAIIFFTSFSDEKSIQRISAINPAAVITKPFDEHSLKKVIERSFNDFRKGTRVRNNDILKYSSMTDIFKKSERKRLIHTFFAKEYFKDLNRIAGLEDDLCSRVHVF